MIQYNEFDIQNIDDAQKLLLELNGEIIDDDEVWDVARCSRDIPIFENILYQLTYSKIEEMMKEKFPDVKFSYYVNCANSSFSISNDVNGDFVGFDSDE